MESSRTNYTIIGIVVLMLGTALVVAGFGFPLALIAKAIKSMPST